MRTRNLRQRIAVKLTHNLVAALFLVTGAIALDANSERDFIIQPSSVDLIAANR